MDIFLIVIFGLFLPCENVCLKKEGIDSTKATIEKIERYSIIDCNKCYTFLTEGPYYLPDQDWR